GLPVHGRRPLRDPGPRMSGEGDPALVGLTGAGGMLGTEVVRAAEERGLALAAWIHQGEPPFDLWPVDIRRFGRPHRDIEWVRARTLELYAKHYGISWPSEEHRSCRPARRSPLYDHLAAAGACFGEKLGWERPNWFAPDGIEPRDVYSFERPNWFPHVGREHRSARERVAVFDQSSFAKFELAGPGAESALSWLCANDVAKPPGSVTYTQMLNRRGGIECDLTVARLAHDRFYIVTGTAFATHDFHWISRNIPAGLEAGLRDVTEDWAVLSLMGPSAREVLGSVTDDDVSDRALPFASCRLLDVAGVATRVLRITYVGELGFELHLPVGAAIQVYDALMGSGARHGIVNAGYRAIESLRLEKGYRAWAADITPNDTPYEAGLGWAVKADSDVAFLGREELARRLRTGSVRRLAGFTVADPDVMLHGRETILRDSERVGWLTSGGWGHTIAKGIGYGYVNDPEGVDEAFLTSGAYELEVAGRIVAAELHLRPLYDPSGHRVRS
ncbi:MAG: glycine cleavage T C-terminal barrel domain-containing protein, partial [Acidimicrobiales bacterium]